MPETEELNKKLEAIWTGDRLNRRSDAEQIHRFISGQLELRVNAGQTRSFVLNIDSDWGSGKTFFLQRFEQELHARGHVAVYINAWEDDHSDDPFMTVVTALLEALEGVRKHDKPLAEVQKKADTLWTSTKRVAGSLGGAALVGGKHYLSKKVGQEALEMLASDASEEDEAPDTEDGAAYKDATTAAEKASAKLIEDVGCQLIDTFKHQKAARSAFSTQLKALAHAVFETEAAQAPIYILIDELDRCRPAYAVELLEQIKHLFSVENFVFVLGSDTTQLAHAVRGLYGAEFDGTRYLKRFVDRTYRFQEAEIAAFIDDNFRKMGLVEHHFTLPPEITPQTLMSDLFLCAKTPLRDIEQFIEIIATFRSVWPWDDLKIDFLSLLPLVFREHGTPSAFERFKRAQDQVQYDFARKGYASVKAMSVSKMLETFPFYMLNPSQLIPPDSEFEEWLHKKMGAENRVASDPDSDAVDPIIPKYPTLLETVARLQDTAPDDA